MSATKLVNRSGIKRFILDKLKEKRPHLGVTRVSADAYAKYEAKIRGLIEDDIDRHPTAGKTFNP